MSKKHVFLRFFSKIAIFACVFCAIPAWSETTCDIDYTPVTGNSWQNGTPTPTNPVEIESVGTKVGNKYAVQVAINNGGGVVDLGTLNWTRYTSGQGYTYRTDGIDDRKNGNTFIYLNGYEHFIGSVSSMTDKSIAGGATTKAFFVRNDQYTDATAFKQSLSGVMLYYQRATDETWTAPTLKTVYLDEPLRKVGDYADVLDYKNGTITRNVGVKVLDGTEDWAIGGTVRFYIDGQEFYNDWAKGFPEGDEPKLYCSHWSFSGHVRAGSQSVIDTFNVWLPSNNTCFLRFIPQTLGITTVAAWKSYIAAQYAAGTPVIVYYPLETPVVEQIENWSCTPPITDIKIATTKYVETEFAPLNTALANAISVVDNVVTQTIAQAGQIATLQNTKQTRPSDDNECPAGKKCLLVTDESGTPHWYPIIEP